MKIVSLHILGVCISILFSALPAKALESVFPDARNATPQDMKIFEHYIGTFHSQKKVFDDGKTEYFFEVIYDWFSTDKSIVKYTVAIVIPSQGRKLLSSEGFYGYDPYTNNIYVFGAFKVGRTGRGALGTLGHKTGEREVWAQSMRENGTTTYVKDSFSFASVGAWKNKTSVMTEESGDWEVISEDMYVRSELVDNS